MRVLHFEAGVSLANVTHAAINQKKEEDMIGKGFIYYHNEHQIVNHGREI